jgi:fluoride exporter
MHPESARRPPFDVLAAIAAGGAIGAVARWAFGETFPVHWQQFPWSTFVENVTGAFLLGLVVTLILNLRSKSRLLQPFLGIGVLGSFTTFSNLSSEILQLVTMDLAPLAILYMSSSILCGLVAATFGILLGRAICQKHHIRSRAP